jgi:hypothetical protein
VINAKQANCFQADKTVPAKIKLNNKGNEKKIIMIIPE